MNRGAWRAAVHRVAKSRTRLKRFSTAQHIPIENCCSFKSSSLHVLFLSISSLAFHSLNHKYLIVHSMPDTMPSIGDAGVKTDMSPLLIDTSKFYYKVNIKKQKGVLKSTKIIDASIFQARSHCIYTPDNQVETAPFMCLVTQSCPTLCDSID